MFGQVILSPLPGISHVSRGWGMGRWCLTSEASALTTELTAQHNDGKYRQVTVLCG